MRNLYFVLLLSFFQFNLFAQDYAPFPYDSVFFESSIPNSDLMPVVKNPNNLNQLQLINVIPALTRITRADFSPPSEDRFAYHNNWMGLKDFYQDTLFFGTSYSAAGFSIVPEFNANIEIDLNKSLMEKDTFYFADINYNYGDTFYVEVTYDSLITTVDDTIKQYAFQLMDSDLNPIDMEISFEYLFQEEYNVNTQVFQISKNNGILKSPDFNFFPYCKQYSFKGKIKEIINATGSYAYKIFKRELGDEIHTKKYYGEYGHEDYDQTAVKKICTNQIFDTLNNAFYTYYDYWERIDEGYFVYYDGTNAFYADSIVSATFEQKIDTIDLDDYVNLNKEIPDGIAVNTSISNHGYFYQSGTKRFMYNRVYDNLFDDDSIKLNTHYDGGGVKSYYVEGEGGKYYNNSDFWIVDFYNPIYVSTSDTTYGTPFTESFILELVEKSTEEITFFIQGNKIIYPLESGFKDFRIYDMTGKLLNYYKQSAVSDGIDISEYHKGAYVLIAFDGKSAKHFKFVR